VKCFRQCPCCPVRGAAAAVLCARHVPRASEARHALPTGRAPARGSARALSASEVRGAGCEHCFSSAGSAARPRADLPAPPRWGLRSTAAGLSDPALGGVCSASEGSEGTTWHWAWRAFCLHALRCDCGCTTSDGTPRPTSGCEVGARRLGQGVVWDQRVSLSIGQYGRPRGVIMRLPLGPTGLSATDPAGVLSGA